MGLARQSWWACWSPWWAVCVCCCCCVAMVASAAGGAAGLPASSTAAARPTPSSYRVSRCNSWRFNVEVNNLRGWKVVPGACEAYVAHYILGGEYREDSAGSLEEARKFAHQYSSSAFSSSAAAASAAANFSYNAWVFDIDETSLSNVPYYAHHQFGAEAYNDTLFEAWANKGIAPVLPATLALFKELKDLGYSLFFLTGRSEGQRHVTASNLRRAGYRNWNGLLLRQSEDQGVTAVLYKSGKRKALENLGYTIVGNVGDQYSDLTGYSIGNRVFKLPNPMYYIA